MNFEIIEREKILEEENRTRNLIVNEKIMSYLLSYFQIFEKADKTVNKKIEEYANKYFEENKIKARAYYWNNDKNYGGAKYLGFDKNFIRNIKILECWGDDKDKEMPTYKQLFEKNKYLKMENIIKCENEFNKKLNYTLNNYKYYNQKIEELKEMQDNMLYV